MKEDHIHKTRVDLFEAIKEYISPLGIDIWEAAETAVQEKLSQLNSLHVPDEVVAVTLETDVPEYGDEWHLYAFMTPPVFRPDERDWYPEKFVDYPAGHPFDVIDNSFAPLSVLGNDLHDCFIEHGITDIHSFLTPEYAIIHRDKEENYEQLIKRMLGLETPRDCVPRTWWKYRGFKELIHG